jgi:hypothetical protein
MNKLKKFYMILVTKPKLKKANIAYWTDSEINSPFQTIKKIDLVYSDNLEDIKTQLLFMGYKILEQSKRQYMHVVYYDLIDI